MNENHDNSADNALDNVAEHTISSLRRQYGVSRHEARRILARFGRSKADLDLLLAGRGRTRAHRRREVRTAPENAPFGID